ncbi:MAG: DUF3179 domain-containing protein [Chloroflexota bacterium]|nr:MAG: DUF3179 domain-containing protein [Chloroflexota bacterium]
MAPDTASEPLPTPRPRRLKPGDLRIAADEDDIPAIFAEDDLFVDAESGDLEWHEDDPIIGLVVGDDARAYPVRLLSNHEIVNDVVGGEPVVVTWCPLCFSALVFSRVVDGKELTFGVSGYLFNDNLVMYDHRTNTLWSQLIAEAIKGAYRGERLALFPSSMTSWNDWKNRFPNTRVLSAERLGLSAEEVVDPYVGYYESGIAGLTGQEETNSVLRPKALVVGVTVGDTARAYPVSDVQSLGLINDKLGGASLLVAFDNGLDSVVVYHQGVGGQQLTFSPAEEDGLLSDDQTGSLWQVSTGKAIDGPLEGQRLGRLAAPLVFWFAWSDLQPKGDVYGR